MSKIVYLFGAGASAGALPLVDQMPKWIETLINEISREELSLNEKEPFDNPQGIQHITQRAYQNALINDLRWLQESAKNHISIDTFAKKLYIKKNFEYLRRLKIILSVYFTIEQTRHRPNFRYDFFFASIMESAFKFSEDIRILTWNYDSQFEYAYSEFSDKKNLSENQALLNIHIKNKKIDNSDLGTFGIYKLNGSTEMATGQRYDQGHYFFKDKITSSLSLEDLYEIVRIYAMAATMNEIIPNFSFAWEPINFENFMENIIKETIDAEILIIIGYSFPYFNRLVDKELILNMRNLRKVHFQSLETGRIIERFKAIRKDWGTMDLIPEADNRYFFIPDELS